MRSATEQALLALIASRTETRPDVMHIFEGMRQAGIPVDGCVAAFDAPVDVATATLVTRRPHGDRVADLRHRGGSR